VRTKSKKGGIMMWMYTYKVTIKANDNLVFVEDVKAPTSMKAMMNVSPKYENDIRNIEVAAVKTSDQGVFVSETSA